MTTITTMVPCKYAADGEHPVTVKYRNDRPSTVYSPCSASAVGYLASEECCASQVYAVRALWHGRGHAFPSTVLRRATRDLSRILTIRSGRATRAARAVPGRWANIEATLAAKLGHPLGVEVRPPVDSHAVAVELRPGLWEYDLDFDIILPHARLQALASPSIVGPLISQLAGSDSHHDLAIARAIRRVRENPTA